MSQLNSLQHYIACFSSMNCNKRQGQIAPHKAMLLLAVMEETAKGHITNGFVPHNERMVRAFEATWKRYVGESHLFNATFATPFFHLAFEPFWELMSSNTYVAKEGYSLTALRESFFGAKLPDDLASYMADTACRQRLKRALLDKYVPNYADADSPLVAAEPAAEYGKPATDATVRMVA